MSSCYVQCTYMALIEMQTQLCQMQSMLNHMQSQLHQMQSQLIQMQSPLNEMQSTMKQMQLQHNKMPNSWHQLPLEMKEAITMQMDAKLRGRFSMCSKLTNKLVRGINGRVCQICFKDDGVYFLLFCLMENGCLRLENKKIVLVKERDDGRSSVFLDKFHVYSDSEAKYSTATDYKETVLNIMGIIGRVITVCTLELEPGRGFKERFEWFRNNLLNRVKLQHVRICIANSPLDCYDESILDLPSHVQIELTVNENRPPNLELFNTYEKLIAFSVYHNNENPDVLTDEDVMKMRNVRRLDCGCGRVTMNGIVWWVKNWITKDDDNERYYLRKPFGEGDGEFSYENVKNRLADVIGKSECLQELHGARPYYWKIEIKKNGQVGGTIKLTNKELTCYSIEN